MKKILIILFLALSYSEIPNRRVVAEWEPALGTIIRWPLGIPTDLVIELANENTIFYLIFNDIHMRIYKQKSLYKRGLLILCRGGRIRTCDPLLPKQDGLVINYPYVLLNNQKFHQQNLISQINQDQF